MNNVNRRTDLDATAADGAAPRQAPLVAVQPPTPGHGNGRRAAEALTRRLATRKAWASETAVASTVATAEDGWGE
ncbi:MAG: hypothetical protein LBS56_07555 [Propionibacteriaceae bacterium]|nr:hypothetical protein [Propionibacteriaceae bacterium]